MAFSRFILALSKSLPSSTKRLHILHIVSNTLLAIKQHGDSNQVDGILKRYVPLLLTLATFADPIKEPKNYHGVMQLINSWYDYQIFTSDQIIKLYERVLEVETSNNSRSWEDIKAQIVGEELTVAEQVERELEDAKWIIPQRHGVLNDPMAPWYELPAANAFYMKRTRGYPLKSYALKQGGYEIRSDGKPQHTI